MRIRAVGGRQRSGHGLHIPSGPRASESVGLRTTGEHVGWTIVPSGWQQCVASAAHAEPEPAAVAPEPAAVALEPAAVALEPPVLAELPVVSEPPGVVAGGGAFEEHAANTRRSHVSRAMLRSYHDTKPTHEPAANSARLARELSALHVTRISGEALTRP